MGTPPTMRHQLRRPLHRPPPFKGCRLRLAACGVGRSAVKTDGYPSDNASPPAQPSPSSSHAPVTGLLMANAPPQRQMDTPLIMRYRLLSPPSSYRVPNGICKLVPLNCVGFAINIAFYFKNRAFLNLVISKWVRIYCQPDNSKKQINKTEHVFAIKWNK